MVALRLHRQTGERRFEGLTLANLAAGHAAAGRRVEALETAQEALAIAREVRNEADVGVAAGRVAAALAELSRHAEADVMFQESVDILSRMGDTLQEGSHQCAHAVLRLIMGDYDGARVRFRRGAALLREIGETKELALRMDEMRAACAAAGIPELE